MKKRILIILSLLLCFTCVFSCIGCESVDNGETDAIETEKNADDATDKKTEKPTDKVTEKPTDKATEEVKPTLVPGVSEAPEPLSKKSYDLKKHSDNIRYIGRTKATDNGTICDHSASGIEFQGYMTGEVKLTVNTYDDVYYTVYVDGARVDKRFYASGKKTLTIANFEGNYFHSIRILKQSEIGWSQSLLLTLEMNGYLLDAPKDREFYIELYGDSLTSAFGNLGPSSAPAPTDRPVYQDATKSYGFLLAEAINADCSILAMSGVGLATGYYDNPFLSYFSKYSHKRGNEEFSFEGARVPDLAIIHLGANDSTQGATKDDFIEKAQELIAYIRNGYKTDVPIIWAYDPSEQVPMSWLNEISDLNGGESAGFYLIELEWRSIEYGAGGHPGLKAHEAHYELLIDLILEKKIIG